MIIENSLKVVLTLGEFKASSTMYYNKNNVQWSSMMELRLNKCIV